MKCVQQCMAHSKDSLNVNWFFYYFVGKKFYFLISLRCLVLTCVNKLWPLSQVQPPAHVCVALQAKNGCCIFVLYYYFCFEFLLYFVKQKQRKIEQNIGWALCVWQS